MPGQFHHGARKDENPDSAMREYGLLIDKVYGYSKQVKGIRGRLDNQDRETLMDIIDDRHTKRSTIISSQIPVSAWYEIIGGEGTIADAILDRIVNSSHRIDLKGHSLRKGIINQE
ncbi:hypothetical protein FQR65_LT17877 [Abscondita terminalis]|nr:hypothetical protein FQR65_LT17877 [Abscondita terminalis]